MFSDISSYGIVVYSPYDKPWDNEDKFAHDARVEAIHDLHIEQIG